MTSSKIKIVYVTQSDFKKEENRVFAEVCSLADGMPISDLFEFELRNLNVKEALEIDLDAMVRAEVKKAYTQIRVPCIVEHAGLIFEGYDTYPGGLTKPMWDFLGEKFIEETRSGGRRVTARAVVAYCDGKDVRTFVGETKGSISDKPKGDRAFYWDTVFVPDTSDTKAKDKTYAEIVGEPKLGLAYKMSQLSQSSRALIGFLEYRRKNPPGLWSQL
jgi:XTP/dITP diphosphohydrolase